MSGFYKPCCPSPKVRGSWLVQIGDLQEQGYATKVFALVTSVALHRHRCTYVHVLGAAQLPFTEGVAKLRFVSKAKLCFALLTKRSFATPLVPTPRKKVSKASTCTHLRCHVHVLGDALLRKPPALVLLCQVSVHRSWFVKI